MSDVTPPTLTLSEATAPLASTSQTVTTSDTGTWSGELVLTGTPSTAYDLTVTVNPAAAPSTEAPSA